MEDIRLENISKRFGETAVLENFSALFPAGRTTCLMGKSGCGKTTALNILMGLISADSGTIQGLEEHRIAAVFQENRLSAPLNAIRNVRFATGGKTTDRREIARALTSTGLDEESLRKPVSELSGGMQRRVAIVRALLSNFTLLILDEPFKGLDDATRLIVMNMVKEYAEGKTLIMVTHDEDECRLMDADVIYMI